MLGVGLERRKELLFNCKFMLPINKRKGGTLLVLRSCFSLEEGMALFILPLPCAYSGYTDQRIHEGFQALIFFIYFNSFSPLAFDSICVFRVFLQSYLYLY